ncbi:DUF7718 family protein [Halosimplex halobium]|uniref:DUF7718 family protein n=1 Tax=Halosimplex halobium TaxID=3396618 RepID=UPI003F573E8F
MRGRRRRESRHERRVQPGSPDEGFDYAEADLGENVQRYVTRFDRCHEIRNGGDL